MNSRGAYIIRRVLLLIPTLLAIYTLTFFLVHATPGNPWGQGDKPVPPLVLERLNEAYGLNDPLWKQYTSYLTNVLQGDFGPSLTQRSRTVSDIIGDTFPVSLKLGLVSMAIALTALAGTGVRVGRELLEHLVAIVVQLGDVQNRLLSADQLPEIIRELQALYEDRKTWQERPVG